MNDNDELELEIFKIRDMIDISKSHILRLVFCSIATGVILWAVGAINRVFMYVFARWNLDIVQNSISGSVPVEVVFAVIGWNYMVGFVVIGLSWMFLGLPKITIVGKSYKRFMDIYYVG